MGVLIQTCCSPDATKIIKVSKDDLANHLFGDGNYKKIEFEHILTQPYEGLLGGALSASFSPKPEDENYPAFVNGLKDIFDHYSKDGLIETKFKAVCYYGKL